MSAMLLYIPEFFGVSIEVYILLVLLAVPVFFVFKKFFSKRLQKSKARALAPWIATFLLVPALYVAMVLLVLWRISYTPSRDFDKALWLSDREGRYQMAGDIINNRLLMGRDSNGVKELLGQPEWKQGPSSLAPVQTWSYDMGMGGGGLGFLFHDLLVKFDSNYKVTVVEHMQIAD